MKKIFVLFSALLIQITMANATEYKYSVKCEFKETFVVWATGEIDAGREYYRVVTGTHYPNCSVSHWNKKIPVNGDVVRHTGLPAVISGIPFLGLGIKKLLFD